MPRYEHKGGAVVTTITSGITSTSTSIVIADATGWPTGAVGPFFAVIDQGTATEEKIEVQSRSGTTLTLASSAKRGIDDTTAATHSANASISHNFTALEADDANDHIYDTGRDDHTQYINNARHDITGRHAFGAALGTPGAPTNIGTTAAAGTGAAPAREDHVHDTATGFIDNANKFAAGVVDEAALASNAVTTVKIGDGAVTEAELGTGAVTETKIGTKAVTKTKVGVLPACRIYNDANITLTTDGTAQALTFNQERYDTDTMHDTGTNPGRITFTTAGIYRVGACARWSTASSPDYTGGAALSIRLNGTTIIAQDQRTNESATTIGPRLSINTEYSFAATDNVEIMAEFDDLNNSPTTVNIIATGNYSPEAWASFICPAS